MTMTDIKTKTIFTIHSTLPFIHHPRNERFLVDNERILEDEPDEATLTADEDATPAPTEAISRPFLRITTDHLPKVPSEGFIFGRDPEASDILLETCANNGVSRKQFALQVIVQSGEGAFLLKNFGRHGTTISSSGDNQRVKDQKAITPDRREFSVYVGNIQVRIEFPDHSQHRDCWRQHWLTYCLNYNHAPSPPAPSTSTFNMDNPWRNDYYPVCGIDRGAEGAVYRVLHRTTAQTYAVKEYPRKSAKPRSEHRLFDKLQVVKHEHIITYFERRNNPPAIVMEFVDGGNLQTAHTEKRLSNIEFKDCVVQITSALDYLHQLPMAHRDIKPWNVMVASRRPIHIKLCDFGMATNRIDMRTFCGTTTYAAPEVLNQRPYSTKVDMWSLGILMLDFCYGAPRYMPSYTTFNWISILDGHLLVLKGSHSDNSPLGLIGDLLEETPENRISAREMLELCEEISWGAPGLQDSDESTDQLKASSLTRVSNKQSDQVTSIRPDETGHVRLFEPNRKGMGNHVVR